ncbi:MAG: hypothetical protein GEV10_00425 [Streptosporangiales bacterium]|nr:hypothetical protein [Streptosporangiales bacterium]
MRHEDLGALAQRQDAVVLRSQLVGCGVSRAHVEAQLAAWRWQTLGPLLVVMHNGPLSDRQRLWAAVLSGGIPAALCARTAAAEAGLVGWEAAVVEIVVPRGTRVARPPGISVRVHESRRFTASDVHPTRLPPQTWPARSVIDAAVWTRRPRSACGLVAAAVQQGVCLPEVLTNELELAGKVRHHRLLRSALVDIGGGAQALSEIDFGRLCARFGLPAPERQVVRLDASGRRRYLDAVLRTSTGRSVVIEIDGAVHLLPERYWDDMQRDNELTIAGDRHLRFPTVALHLEPAKVAGQIRRALGLPPDLSEPWRAIARQGSDKSDQGASHLHV